MVPAQVTASQVVGLLKQFKQARLNRSLGTMLPATEPRTQLGDQAVANLYISDPKYATPEVVGTWLEEPMLRADLYPRLIRSKRQWNRWRTLPHRLNDTSVNPNIGSIGFADNAGVHSEQYRRIF